MGWREREESDDVDYGEHGLSRDMPYECALMHVPYGAMNVPMNSHAFETLPVTNMSFKRSARETERKRGTTRRPLYSRRMACRALRLS